MRTPPVTGEKPPLCHRRRSCVVAVNVLVFTVVALSPSTFGQDAGVLGGRFSVTPLVSFRSNLELPIQGGIVGTDPRMALDSSPSYGVSFGWLVQHNNIVEFRWTREESYARIQNASVALPTTLVTMDQFHVGFSHEYVSPHRAAWARPFVTGSVGATNMFSGSNSGSVHLSVGFGAGIKFLLSRHWGFRMQAEWLPIFLKPQDAELCGGACAVRLGGTLSSQAEVAMGPIFQF